MKQMTISHANLVNLLKMQADHSRKIEKLQDAGLEMDGYRVELLDVVMDVLGVPKDNTFELTEKYGQAAYDREDCFSRDWFSNRWDQIIDSGTDADIEQYPAWVISQLKSGAYKQNFEMN